MASVKYSQLMDTLHIQVGSSPISKALHQTPDALKSGQRLARVCPASNTLHQCSGVMRWVRALEL